MSPHRPTSLREPDGRGVHGYLTKFLPQITNEYESDAGGPNWGDNDMPRSLQPQWHAFLASHRIAQARKPGSSILWSQAAKAGGVLDRLSELGESISGEDVFGSTIAAIASNYGVARDALVEKIIEDISRYAMKAKRRCDKFVSMVSMPTFRPAQTRYKEAFGKVYAALCLAVDLKLVPFDRKHTKRAILAMYRRSELQLVQPSAVHEQLKKLAGVLDDDKQCPRWVKGGPQPGADIWALRCENGSQPEFYIEPKKFERIWGKSEAKMVETHLLANGVQLRDPAGKAHRQPPGKPFASTENKRPRVIVLDAVKFADMVAGLS